MRKGRTWAAVKRRMGLTRRDRSERGAVLVEAAIVIPILMMITLGIIEYGGAYRENAAVAGAARAGARVASSLPKTDFGGTGTCTAPDSGPVVAAACRRPCSRSAPMRRSRCGSTRSRPGNVPPFTSCTNCVGYNWNPSTKTFNTATKLGPGWLTAKQNACASGPPDQFGVYIKVNHKAITKMFGGDRTLTGTTIMRLEPYVGTLACASS